jgi:hypothetical protein
VLVTSISSLSFLSWSGGVVAAAAASVAVVVAAAVLLLREHKLLLRYELLLRKMNYTYN